MKKSTQYKKFDVCDYDAVEFYFLSQVILEWIEKYGNILTCYKNFNLGEKWAVI